MISTTSHHGKLAMEQNILFGRGSRAGESMKDEITNRLIVLHKCDPEFKSTAEAPGSAA
jgi:hypothetical protein